MKDTKQQTKEAKKFRLHSILKLHARIMNQKLMNHAMGLQSILEKVKTTDNDDVFNQIVDLMIDFGLIGKHNFDVSEKANKLQLSSSQEELEALFKLVTRSEKDVLKELTEELEEEENKCECNCAENKSKSTKQVKAKVVKIVASSKEEALEKINQLLSEDKII